jgi:hypothetical protein
MREIVGGVVINEVEAEPLSDYVLDFLSTQRKESPYLDFKLTLDIEKGGRFPEIAKDFFAFSNWGGGWILLGWLEHSNGQFVPVGLPESFRIDQASLQEKFNAYIDSPLTILYTTFEKDLKHLFTKAKPDVQEKVNSTSNKFAAIYIPPSRELLIPKQDGTYQIENKTKTVFIKGQVYYRRGTQSTHPSPQELSLIKKRIVKEDYRISVISGEPDELEEELHSNLFEVTKLPASVYIAESKAYTNLELKSVLSKAGVFPNFFHKFKEWDGEIIIFENLFDVNCPYRELVEVNTIRQERTEEWLQNPDKRRIIVELLRRELIHHAVRKGLMADWKLRLYYPTEEHKRKEKWTSRYKQSNNTVAARMYAQQLQRYIYWHTCIRVSFLQIGKIFYLRIDPSFLITEDGKTLSDDKAVGSIVTRLTYNKYNDTYLNSILFWIQQLSTESVIQIKDYFSISTQPSTTTVSVGILYDIPSTEFRLNIDNPEDEDVIVEEDNEI